MFTINGVPEPRFIFWESTVACNLECVHCRRLEISKFLSKNDLTTEEAKNFIRELGTRFSTPPVLVLSGGEPLKRPDIFQLTHTARDFHVPVALATNGTLINRPLAQEIVKSGIRRVSISLDGAFAETHDNFRRMPGSFEKAIDGFQHLKDLGMPVQMNVTLTRRNLGELDALYQLALNLGADGLYFFLLVPVGCGLEIKEEYQLTPGEYENALIRIHEFALEQKIHIRPICAPHYFRILVQGKSPLRRENAPAGMNQLTKGCLAGTGICFVSHKGDVFPCGYLPVSCGNILKQSFKDIWDHSLMFQSLRNPETLEGKCGVCEFKNICSGCRARAYEETGNFLDEEPNCLYEPRMVKGGVR